MILTLDQHQRVQLAEYTTTPCIAYQAAGTSVWFHDLHDALIQEKSLPAILKLAIDEAQEWHKEQVYEKEPFTPYIIHCWEVSTVFEKYVDKPTMAQRIGTWHRDLFEDTAYPHAKHLKTYGEQAHGIVQACTGHGPNRKTRQATIHQQLLENTLAIDSKISDRAVNMSHAKTNAKLGPIYAKEAGQWDEIIALSASTALTNYWYEQRNNLPHWPLSLPSPSPF